MGFTIPLRGGGFIELPPDITTHEQLAEWGHLWATFGEAERRRARNRPMTRRASRRYPR